MLVFILSVFLYNSANCHVIDIEPNLYSDELVKCVTDIVGKYLAPQKVLTYIGNRLDDDAFLEAIHNLDVVTMISRRAYQKLTVPHEGYFISVRHYSVITRHFPILSKEPSWNPEARFLFVVRSLEVDQVELIFNHLLEQHVVNAIVINATEDAHIYSYNPFDNYGCGKRYESIIRHGKCSQVHAQDLYPYKFITGLQNCTFSVAMPNWPPYTSIPNSDSSSSLTYGIEPYMFRLIGEMEGFKINITIDDTETETFSTVSSNMEADGFLKRLQERKADVIMGGMLLTPSRAVAFNYVYDLMPYVDELRFLVKRASYTPLWKYIYIEFDATVWLLIVMSLMFYSIVMIFLLNTNDKGQLVLKLLDNLLLHGNNIQCKSTVKCVFIIWVWSTYLINAFYQSSLFSLTTNPAMEKQISTEEEIIKENLKPCFSESMVKYYIESAQSQTGITSAPGCRSTNESIIKVMNSKEDYTIMLYGLFLYKIQDFMGEYGNLEIYALNKPYSKVIYCMYFYKGFPLTHNLRVSALRIREMGLVEKVLSDVSYVSTIKYHYRSEERRSHFAIPWRFYALGCVIATITLILEILSKQN